MQKTPVIEATQRDRTGSRYASRVREQGRLPAVVYGHKQDPVAIAVDASDTLSHIHKGEKVFELRLPEQDGQTVLLKDVQFDYLGTQIIHCDFARVDLSERVHSRVSLHLIGEAVGLKQGGAILMHPATEIEIECAVRDLPEFLEADVTELDVGDSMYASDVQLPEGMSLVSDEKAVVAAVRLAGKEASGEEEEVSAEEGAEPEVISEKAEDGDKKEDG